VTRDVHGTDVPFVDVQRDEFEIRDLEEILEISIGKGSLWRSGKNVFIEIPIA